MPSVQSQHKGNHKGGRPSAASFVVALNTGHILELRRKTCALLRAKTSVLLRRRTCTALRARTRALFRANAKEAAFGYFDILSPSDLSQSSPRPCQSFSRDPQSSPRASQSLALPGGDSGRGQVSPSTVKHSNLEFGGIRPWIPRIPRKRCSGPLLGASLPHARWPG